MLISSTPRVFHAALLGGVLSSLAAFCLPSSAGAQAVTTPLAPKALFISVLEGEGELNDIRARTAREPIVEVQDENHKPVAGALVLFAIDSGGGQPAATFSGLANLTVRTGADGRAVGTGYRITNRSGNFRIAVTATVGTLAATAIIHQTNYAHGSSNSVIRAVSTHKAVAGGLAELAGFAVASTVILVESQDPSTTSITVGPGTVGAPSARTGARR